MKQDKQILIRSIVAARVEKLAWDLGCFWRGLDSRRSVFRGSYFSDMKFRHGGGLESDESILLF